MHLCMCVRKREKERNLYMGAVISALIIVVTHSALHAARVRYPRLHPVYWEEPGDDAQTIIR